MSFTTYSDFQNAPSSEKVGLCILEARKQLVGWVVHSGSVYKLTGFNFAKIVAIKDSATALTEVTALASVVAGTFYNDRDANILYLRTASSVNPNGRFIGMTFQMFFSNVALIAPHDLASGVEVEWLPMLEPDSDFGVELDNQNQLGVAIEGSGTIKFKNDQSFWATIFDRYYFENQRAMIYSWNRHLPITQAKIIYRGRVQGKSYTPQQVSFQLKDFINELRAPVDLALISDYSGELVPDSLAKAYQRRIYGYVYGHRPTNIDQVLDGYALAGTVSITLGGTALTGSGTAFKAKLSPGDRVLIGDDDEAYTVTIDQISSDTAATVSDAYTGETKSGAAFVVIPDRAKDYTNRVHLVAGHALTLPTATVTAAEAFNYFDVSTVSGFRAGEQITVGSQTSTILRISGLRIFLETVLTFVPTVGDTVIRDSISNVRLGSALLTKTRDYTYSASGGTLTLTSTAEFNVAPTVRLTGTLTFTNASEAVSGTATAFTSELKPGDWIRATGQSDFFQILSITSDTALTLRTNATYSAGPAVGFYRSPAVYKEGSSVLSCDVIGMSDTGLTTGSLLYRAPEIVQDILERAGLTTSLDAASFTDANTLTTARIGIVLPAKYADTKAPTVRDAVNLINKSVFGALVQNADFNLSYSILDPRRTDSITQLDESDALKFEIRSNSDKLVKTATVEFRPKEYDYLGSAASLQTSSQTSLNATYLADSTKEFRTSSVLVDEADAAIAANRWSFIFEVSSSTIRLDSKLRLSRVSVGDRVEFSHPKMYRRVGSSHAAKVGGIQRARRSILDSSIELEDLANAFSRCATITSDTAAAYDSANLSERLYNGYITDDYGMQSNDPDTFGVNLIF